MFESSLLRARATRTTIRPLLADLNGENLALCRSILEIYLSSIGQKRKVLNAKLQAVEKNYDYRFVRGLAELLDRRSTFEPEATPLDPEAARRAVFSASQGLAATEEERNRAMDSVASLLGVPTSEVERAMYADLDEEMILVATEGIPEEEMLKRYNVELVETLLMRAAKLRFTISDGWKSVFRRIKMYGLMYDITGYGSAVSVEVHGPAQLFKLMDRYGSAMAKLLPEILKAKDWSISAEILSRDKKRFMTFNMTSTPLLFSSAPDEPYDSSVEERFAKSFSSLDPKWRVRREAEVILAGGYAFIPDFLFELGGRKVYFEIVGFWTKEYLERKIAKLKSLPPTMDLLVAANEDLACSSLASASKNLFYYSGGKVQLKPVIDYLKAIEKQVSEEQSRLVSFTPTGDIFDLEEYAKKNSLLLSAVEKYVEGRTFPGYQRVGGYFIRNEKLTSLGAMLRGVKDYAIASEILAREGVSKPDHVFAALHYSVVWKDLTAAELVPSGSV